jgi:hypothetical protein
MENINLYELKEAFSQDPVVVLAGEHGVGKTCLAEAYIKDDDCEGKIIYKLDAHSFERVARDCQNVMRELVIAEAEMQIKDGGISDAVRLILNNLSEKSFLFVFDNIKTIEVKASLACALRGQKLLKDTQQILLISEQQFCVDNAMNLTLFKWTNDEAYIFLSDNINSKRITQDLRDLADRLRHLPLALDMAQLYINNTGISIEEYNLRLDAMLSKLTLRSIDIKYAATLLSMEEAFQYKGAKEILQLIAARRADGMHLHELEKMHAKRITLTKDEFGRAIDKLLQYKLIQVDDGLATAHEVICDAIALSIKTFTHSAIFAKGASRAEKKQNLNQKADAFNILDNFMLDTLIFLSRFCPDTEKLKPFFMDFRKLNYNERKQKALLNKILSPEKKAAAKSMLINLSRIEWDEAAIADKENRSKGLHEAGEVHNSYIDKSDEHKEYTPPSWVEREAARKATAELQL